MCPSRNPMHFSDAQGRDSGLDPMFQIGFPPVSHHAVGINGISSFLLPNHSPHNSMGVCVLKFQYRCLHWFSLLREKAIMHVWNLLCVQGSVEALHTAVYWQECRWAAFCYSAVTNRIHMRLFKSFIWGVFSCRHCRAVSTLSSSSLPLLLL